MTADGAGAQPGRPRDWTLLEVLRWTAERFRARGLPSPRLDAELLVGHALGISRIGLYTMADRLLEREELARVRALIERRQAGHAVAALTGRKEFWGLELSVGPEVLIPRPETETLVEVALDLLPAAPRRRRAAKARDAEPVEAHAEATPETPGEAPADPPAASPPTPLRLLDVGTGSGAIALALKQQHPTAEVVATDVSADALARARDNAQRLGLPIVLLHGDLLASLPQEARFDLIAANLPYIPSGDIPALAPEVRHEPHLALDGGPDGLALIRRLVGAAPAHLAPGGCLVLELGHGQADTVIDLLRAAGFSGVDRRQDLAGIDRVVFGRWGEATSRDRQPDQRSGTA